MKAFLDDYLPSADADSPIESSAPAAQAEIKRRKLKP